MCKYWVWKTHSVLALSKPDNWLVKVISMSKYNTPPVIEDYDLYWKSRWKNWLAIRIQWDKSNAKIVSALIVSLKSDKKDDKIILAQANTNNVIQFDKKVSEIKSNKNKTSKFSENDKIYKKIKSTLNKIEDPKLREIIEEKLWDNPIVWLKNNIWNQIMIAKKAFIDIEKATNDIERARASRNAKKAIDNARWLKKYLDQLEYYEEIHKKVA